MCGIAGLYHKNNNLAPDWIKKINDRQKHRGPDDSGYLGVNTKTLKIELLGDEDTSIDLPSLLKKKGTNFNLFLGHRRLSVLDLSTRGHQPMSYGDKNSWIVYNGEIYNYMELREELTASGYEFCTRTDTEVLLAAYTRWGFDLLNKIDGMWSFVIYDKRRNLLFGSRDRFGVKPLYYYRQNQYFMFASEVKAFTALKLVNLDLNYNYLGDYLFYGIEENGEKTIFKNIKELEPSCAFTLHLKTNSFKKWQYYRLQYNNQWEGIKKSKLDKYLTDINRLIKNSIAKRLRSDVAVGSCLSGGIDSSVIVTVINNIMRDQSIEQLGEKQKIFTASFKHDQINESKWAALVAGKTETQWFQTCPTAAELLNDLQDLIYAQDTPIGSTSVYAQYRVMKLAAERGIKVMLDGQGGDELFAGYNLFYDVFFLNMLRRGNFSRILSEFIGIKNSPISRNYLISQLVKRVGKVLLPEKLKKHYRKNRIKEMKYIKHDFVSENVTGSFMLEEKRLFSLNKMLSDYFCQFHLRQLLKYEDRNSMHFGIEARTPFVDDRELTEYVFNIPGAYKIVRGWSKYLLRNSMQGILPDRIRLRKDKIGFVTPEGLWLQQIKKELRQYISDDVKDLIEVDLLKKDWDKLIDSQQPAGITNVWRLVCFMIWKKVYNL